MTIIIDFWQTTILKLIKDMSDKSLINSEFSYCEFESDNDGEGMMKPPNLTTEDQRQSSSTTDVDKSQESSSSSSMGVEQKPAEETITIGQSESRNASDLLNQGN
jgi:hypothetical protein